MGFNAMVCGAAVLGWNDLIVDIDVSVLHDQTDATIVIGTTLDQGAADESWGIRDFELYMEGGTL